MIKNAIIWFDRNICIYKEQRFSIWKRRNKCNNLIKLFKKWLTLMIQKNFDVTEERIKEDNPNWQ